MGRGQWDDWYKRNSANPFDFNKAKGDVPLAFFAGHVAGWYDFAAGALTGVSANITNPSLTLCDLHRITVITAVSLVNGNWQQTAAGFGLSQALLSGYGIPPSPTGNNQAISVSFKAGALSAIAALAIATKNDWGLAGQNC